MRHLILAGAVAAFGIVAAGHSQAATLQAATSSPDTAAAAPVIAASIPDDQMGLPIVQAYWAYGPYGRYWVEPHRDPHRHPHGWVDRWGHWHPYN